MNDQNVLFTEFEERVMEDIQDWFKSLKDTESIITKEDMILAYWKEVLDS